jgi:hypothetical protein
LHTYVILKVAGLNDKILLMKRDKKKTKDRVKEFVKLKKKEMELMQQQLDLLDQKYKQEQMVLKQAPPPVKLGFDEYGHPTLQHTNFNKNYDMQLTEREKENYFQSLHLKKLEDEYLQHIGKICSNLID